MSNWSDYTDGIPVRISEKFKPPKEIHLTTKLIQQISRTQAIVAFDDYNFDLERKIMSKTTEWINFRMKEKTDRQQRIQRRDLERTKRIEKEQKEKLNQVSYPSADELTSSCDEEEEDKLNEASHSKPCSSSIAVNQQIIPSEKLFSENFNSNTILMPTQAITDITTNKKSHRRYASNSSNKIDFSFFESDASPFDHLEMKSMNEMEELAKVLKSTSVKNSETTDNDISEEKIVSNESDERVNNNNNNNNNVNNNNIDNQSASAAATEALSYSIHNNCNDLQHQMYSNYFYGTSSSNAVHQNISPALLYNQNSQNNCYYTQNFTHTNYHPIGNNNNFACESSSDVNKSKSVPDIIKELNDELNNSERRRIRNRNNSQTSHKNIEEKDTKSTSIMNSDDQLKKLPDKSQALAKQICLMGFNKDLVIRTLMRIGDNDKKIVEHLISLSELLQMGFEEDQVSEALIKFDNDKDQALEYLIS